ncbi:hypothetical protein Bca4012_058787 [Brassica carinata]|uniref:Uncharacterized protein n=1 Tax=Brassica carinata TaxID=52824 RepID=A0A8X7W4K2_BRACI|nr:hypothetical protein Bca52824_016509 [Brassica carinata]
MEMQPRVQTLHMGTLLLIAIRSLLLRLFLYKSAWVPRTIEKEITQALESDDLLLLDCQTHLAFHLAREYLLALNRVDSKTPQKGKNKLPKWMISLKLFR